MADTEIAQYMRRALKALGLTGKGLADQMTQVRLDEQRTSESTVSRWLSGKSIPDPGVILYLQERLRALKPRLPTVVSQIVISVGGGKGGVGATSMAYALSVVASQVGLRTALLGPDSSVLDLTRQACSASGVTHRPVNGEGRSAPTQVDFMLALDDIGKADEIFDVIVLDLPARAFYEKGFSLLASRIDRMVLPFCFSSSLEIHGMLVAIELLGSPERFPILPVNLARFLHNDALIRLREDAPQLAMLAYEFAVPFYVGGLLRPEVTNSFNQARPLDFICEDAGARYYDLLAHILQLQGIDLGTQMIPSTRLTFKELVDRIAPKANLV